MGTFETLVSILIVFNLWILLVLLILLIVDIKAF